MSQDFGGVYLPTSDPNTFESTPLSNAGWYDEGQHGGSVAALIVGHAEKTPTLVPMEVARLTVELFRVVPLVNLTIDIETIREGKKIQVLQARLAGPDSTLLAVATIHRLRVADLPTPAQDQTTLRLAAPDDSTKPEGWGIGPAGKVMFHRNALEMREARGGFSMPGPGAMWVRLTTPIVAGEDPTPAQRAVAAADFPNGLSGELDQSWVFMNSDLTVHIGRTPLGEWVALDAISHYSEVGRGVASGTLWDSTGWVGRTAQTLFLDRS